MNKEQVYQLLEESFGNEQGSYLDTSPMNHLSKQDAGDPKFMLRLVVNSLDLKMIFSPTCRNLQNLT